jgi:serine/threonine-protein kinase RsbW
MVATGQQQLRLTLWLPRHAACVRTVRQVVDAVLRGSGVDQTCREEISVALVEACNNVVLHARSVDEYEVSTEISEDRCLVSVTDVGAGFTPLAQPQHLPSPRAESGRGLYLIAALADQLSIKSRPGGGTMVEFAKNLTYAGRG